MPERSQRVQSCRGCPLLAGEFEAGRYAADDRGIGSELGNADVGRERDTQMHALPNAVDVWSERSSDAAVEDHQLRIDNGADGYDGESYRVERVLDSPLAPIGARLGRGEDRGGIDILAEKRFRV